ncbi:N-acylamino acid racemase [Agrilactobacillus composti DSM 18527 = JCM 14202]|uniref:o-succinylbenzoate synthase n=1 Tax=Agrilactobacillus composti DSM 18527 = JCM 14202 TaxID=1423734 RepID=X0PTP3_9LACO|nr:o-succinylbenzoate synthase [Agrilactobacillus composti]KRM36860.1 N-acylamino acid racemase [Agrilactobacillus composti DSM 18527 = JCM 14202]GAF41412.1 O-succinylbenzoate synthase [Agrilactobacillus composti DSM 18527 = JCM 14202]
MHLTAIQLLPVTLALNAPFTTNHDTMQKRHLTLVALTNELGHRAIGELEALDTPLYNPETQFEARAFIQSYLGPKMKDQNFTTPGDFNRLFQDVAGHQMAKAALEMPLWALFAQGAQLPLATYLSRAASCQVHLNIPVGISLGLNGVHTLTQQIQAAQVAGYRRIKLKVAGLADLLKIKQLRGAFPNMAFMLDGNAAFKLADMSKLQSLDHLNLTMLEQPLSNTDFVAHGVLQANLKTPLCLDENIHTLDDVQTAIKCRSAHIINVKPARVGGFQVALDIMKLCHQHGLGIWIGGMVESDLGRLYSQTLARLSLCTYPGDVGPASQFFKQTLILNPPVLKAGRLQFINDDTPGLPIHLAPALQDQLNAQPNLLR